MAQLMTPSVVNTISAGQIGKICELFAARLRKANLASEPIQQVLEHQGESLAAELVATVRKYVEAVSLIIRRARVDRTRTPEEALAATGRAQYTNADVVATMPRGQGDEVEVIFFKVDRFMNDTELEKEYEIRGLKPADPYSLAQVNADDPAFADKYPNSTHWKDASKCWCFTTFDCWDGERDVNVRRDDGGWRDFWWFAGLRK